MVQPINWREERKVEFRKLIRQLPGAVDQLTAEFSEFGRKFTLDGHLVGSIGEVVAAYSFNLKLLPNGTPVHDAQTGDEKLVQIKTTGGTVGVALSSSPDHLIVLGLRSMKFELIYNGPGELVWKNCRRVGKNGQRSIGLHTLLTLNAGAAAEPKIPQVQRFPSLNEG
jgi:uncharacterized protein DUF6998